MNTADFERNLVAAKTTCWYLAVRLLAHREDRENLWQETCLRAWRCRDKFDGRASFGTWMKVIMWSIWCRQMRLTYLNPVLPITHDVPDVRQNPEDMAIAGDLIAQLAERLSALELEVFRLRLRGATFEEIGLQIGSGRGQIQKVMARVRRKYRAL